MPKYKYPAQVATSTQIAKLTASGIELKLKADGMRLIRALDAQQKKKKSIYGAGFLLSEKAAAEKAAAEKAIVWQLSEREINIIKNLSMEKGSTNG